MTHFDAHTAVIVGLGSAGRRHLRNLRTLGVERFILVRTGRSTLGEVEEAPPGTVAVRSVEAAIERGPTIAVISNPTSMHVEPAIAVAEAGCHLLIEKPVVHRLEDLSRLTEAVGRAGVTAAVGCQFRFHPLIERLRSLIGGERLGRVYAARAVYREHLPAWHPWEDHRHGYAAREDLGGGCIRTLIHAPDILRYLFGPIESASAAIARCPSLETSVPDDAASLTLGFEAGVTATVELDLVTAPPENGVQVFGDHGRASIDLLSGRLEFIDRTGESTIESVPSGFERNDLFVALARNFLEAIAEGRDPRTPLAQGVDVLRPLLHARDRALDRLVAAA